MKMRSPRVASAAWLRSAGRKRLGSDNTHCRIGTRGMTESTRCAAVAAMRLVLQDGQTPRNEAEWLFNSNELQRSHAQPEPCNLPRSVFSQWVSESNG